MIEFDEEKHEYSLKGKKFISVTQLIDKVTKDFDADSIIDKMLGDNQLYLGNKKELLGMTKEEIKNLWDVNGTAKSRYGTFIHSGAEYIATNYPCDLKELGMMRPEFKQVQKFFKTEGYKLVEAEKKVFSERFRIAGTMDLLLEKDGKYYIGDWKTNVGKDLSDFEGSMYTENMSYPLNNVPDLPFWHYALQFSIYRYIMEEESEDKDLCEFGGQFIIHLQESKANCPYPEMKQITYKKIDTPYMKQEVEALIKWWLEEDKK